VAEQKYNAFPPKRVFRQFNIGGNFERSRAVQSKPIHYWCLGDSRDSYIGANNGGFTNDMGRSDSKGSFYAQLRAYESPQITRSPSNHSLKSLSPSGSEVELPNLNRDFFVES
jgi:hypothetical protein